MKVAVLVSGGVDSSVALALLKRQGYDVTAFYLKIWLEDELAYLGNCPWQEDLAYVEQVCKKLKVPLEVISLQKEYWDIIVRYTIAEIKAGRTPNPDVLCNRYIKFGAFIDKIDSSFDKIASGHYAVAKEDGGITRLCASPDDVKDQTYFLARLTQAQLDRLMFPVGAYTKAEIRALAHEFDLPTKDRKDSQGICFLGKLPFNEFVKAHLGTQEGDLVEFETGKSMGKHNGYWFYTIGQRQGIGLGGGPWYVAAKDIVKNHVYISRNYYAQDKVRNTCVVVQTHWFDGVVPNSKEISVKLRHGKARNACTVIPLADDAVRIMLAERDQGIASGQFAVFYQGDRCLGSGIIAQEEVKVSFPAQK